MLSSDRRAATVLVNSTLALHLLQMLGVAVTAGASAAAASKLTVTLRERLLTVLALLFRHAPVIDTSTASSATLAALYDQLRDSSPLVRRKAIAAAGELSYYLTSQDARIGAATASTTVSKPVNAAAGIGHTDTSTGAAALPLGFYTALIRCLRVSEDNITRHYAVRTLENLIAQDETGAVAQRMGTSETVGLLLQNFSSAANQETFAAACAASMAHLAVQSKSLLQLLWDKLGLDGLRKGLEDRHPRVQQAFLNILNGIMLQGVPRVHSTLLSEPLSAKTSVLSSLVLILEAPHPAPVSVSKVFLSLALLGGGDAGLLCRACDMDLATKVERIRRAYLTGPLAAGSTPRAASLAMVGRAPSSSALTPSGRATARVQSMPPQDHVANSITSDQRRYMESCYDVLRSSLAQAFARVCTSVSQQLSRLTNRQHAPLATIRSFQQSTAQFRSLSTFASSELTTLLSDTAVDALSVALERFAEVTLAETNDFKGLVLQFLESLLAPTHLAAHHSVLPGLLNRILPSVCAVLESSASEHSFLALKAVSEFLSFALSDRASSDDAVRQQTVALMLSHFLPRCRNLLLSQDDFLSLVMYCGASMWYCVLNLDEFDATSACCLQYAARLMLQLLQWNSSAFTEGFAVSAPANLPEALLISISQALDLEVSPALQLQVLCALIDHHLVQPEQLLSLGTPELHFLIS